MANRELPTAFKNVYRPDTVRHLADLVAQATPSFDADAFLAATLPELDALEMKARVDLLARALHAHLHLPFPAAVETLLSCLGPAGAMSGKDFWGPSEATRGLTSLAVWPLTHFVACFGRAHPELSIDALGEMTRRFTAEFALRPFLLAHQELTLARLTHWVASPDQHLRRAASESTRTRLPWGIRLKPFIDDPQPVLRLIRPLRADPEEYVQRSVGNNLNDLGKDHPELLLDTAEAWIQEPKAARATTKIVRRGLRSLVKRGEPRALKLLGFSVPARALVSGVSLESDPIVLGETQVMRYSLISVVDQPQRILVDYVLHLVRARGRMGSKVFKGSTFLLRGRERREMVFKLPLKPVTTRRYYPGEHRLEILVCGDGRGSLPFVLAFPQGNEAP